MEQINQQITSSSSPGGNDQPLNSDNFINQSAADDVNLNFSNLQLDDENDDDEDEDGDFTFACVGDTDSPTTKLLEDDKIRTVFPLFDQSLLSGGDYDAGNLRLPINPPVDKVFIQSPFRYSETDGTVQVLSKKPESESGTPEMTMKSNSTGFSNLWRVKNEMNRSNSDSRDAFVFLEPEAKANAGEGSTTRVNAAGGGKGKAVKKGLNTKKSAHEVYLKQKGGQSEEERRRSYLPYRPGLMGFFTNVNGGLSKNVHPF